MSREVTNAREKVAGHQMLVGADSAAHPPLANTLARLARNHRKVPPPLLRVPRSSVPPPTPESRTALTPAPVFDEDVELLEDSGLLTLEPSDSELSDSELSDSEIVEELSARFLIDESAREIVHTPVIPPSVPSLPLEAIDEVDSEHLAFVETRGEIHGRVSRPRPLSEGPKIRLTSLHEQALAEGIALYSDGVPSHNLQQSGQISQTLRIKATRSPAGPTAWRHLPLVIVFAAGIGAGVFFAMKKDSASEAASAVMESSELADTKAVALEAPEAPMGQDDSSHQETQSSDPMPVVIPLVDDELQVRALAAETSANEEAAVAAELETLSEVTTEAKEARAAEGEIEPALATLARSKATPRTSETSNSPSANQPTSGTGDPGVLMLAAKPPCDILIDGKDTGLMTPQRVLHLAPGKHKVTLVNEEHGLKDSFSVSIRSGEKTKVIRDITNKIK